MKKIMLGVTLCSLVGCATQLPVKTGKDFNSAIEMSLYFYKSTAASKFGDVEPEKITYKEIYNEYKYAWCSNSKTPAQDFVVIAREHCTSHGGSLVNDKWCLANDDKAIKYAFTVNNFVALTTAQKEKQTFCDAASFVRIRMAEYTPANKSRQAQLFDCPRAQESYVLNNLGEDGKVTVLHRVSKEGKVLNTKVSTTSGSQFRDIAASEQFKECEFIPKFEKGIPVDSDFKIIRIFKENNQ
jgi:hypothetical protein